MQSAKSLSAEQLDILREIGNIGAGNVATALASLLGTRVNITVPKAAFLSLEEVLDHVGGMEESVACVQLRVTGDIQGAIVYLFSEASALHLVEMLLGRAPGEVTALDDMGRSVLMEAGNILTGNFAGAISTLTGLDLKTGVPMLACDMLGAVLSAGLAASGYAEDNILLVDTVFSEGDTKAVQSHFLLLTEMDSLAVLVEALGITM